MKHKPTEKQLRFLDWEFGAFFHFGIRSFNHGHKDWDGEPMPLSTFNPDSLDCEQWICAVKNAGAKYAVLTAKHHDGFANWPSAFTEYSVKNTPWKNGKGDVVREFTDACRKHRLAVGIYYSPAQWGEGAVSFENGDEYDDYFINQITELLTDYGKIDYLWFDACGSDGHKYNEKRIIKAIRSLQPEILIFNMWDPDTHWCGNEFGFADLPNNNVRTVEINGESKTVFLPDECDCRIREDWFYEPNPETLKSVDELVGMYELSVGRGANLLLNIGPDNHGLLPESDVERLKEFAEEIARRYSSPLDFQPVVKESDNVFSISYSEEKQKEIGRCCKLNAVKSVILTENITDGNSVTRFKLYAHLPSINPIYDEMTCIYSGETVGHKAICRFPAVKTAKITLKILEHEGEAKITDIKAYRN